jgi:hypothetical protein
MPNALLGRGLLSARAEGFLRSRAEWVPVDADPAEDAAQAAECAAWFGVPASRILAGLSVLRERYAGVRYRSLAWTFDEVITFAPRLDYDESDPEPLVSLLEHSVAHPFGVWANLDGTVYYLFPGAPEAGYVKAFDRPEQIIESDALHYESLGHRLVRSGTGTGASVIAGRAARELQLISLASGATERWWQGEGFRVHASDSWARMLRRPALAKSAAWAESSDGESAALAFLDG